MWWEGDSTPYRGEVLAHDGDDNTYQLHFEADGHTGWYTLNFEASVAHEVVTSGSVPAQPFALLDETMDVDVPGCSSDPARQSEKRSSEAPPTANGKAIGIAGRSHRARKPVDYKAVDSAYDDLGGSDSGATDDEADAPKAKHSVA